MLIITITNYNKSQYTNRLLDSLYSQIEEDIIILFVDDASTDNSLDIVKKHPIYKQNCFKVIEHKENMWVSSCRNEGIKLLKNVDWITFIDGDDFVEPNYIKTLKKYMNNGEYDVFIFDYNDIPANETIDIKSVVRAQTVMCWSRLYKGKYILKNNIKFDNVFKNIGYGEDVDFNISVMKNNPKIKVCKDKIYNYTFGVKNSLSNFNQYIDNE